MSESKFSVKEEPKESRINILLHPLGQLHTMPGPRKSIKNLKMYYLRSLEDEGVDIKRSDADKILDPIIKDFLEKIFTIAKDAEMELPESYKEIYEELRRG